MNKFKNYISTYLFSFLGYEISFYLLIIFLPNINSQINSSFYLLINHIFKNTKPHYQMLGVVICFLIEWFIKNKFKYNINIKNSIINFIFKLGIFLGLLPFTILLTLLAIIMFIIILTTLLNNRILTFLGNHISEMSEILLIIFISIIIYIIYLLAKFVFKKDKN